MDKLVARAEFLARANPAHQVGLVSECLAAGVVEPLGRLLEGDAVTPAAGLLLARHPNERVRSRLAERLDLTAESAAVLAVDPEPWVRSFLACNPSVGPDLVAVLLRDEERVAGPARRRARLTVPQQRELLMAGAYDALWNPHLDADVVREVLPVFGDVFADTFNAVLGLAENPALPAFAVNTVVRMAQELSVERTRCVVHALASNSGVELTEDTLIHVVATDEREAELLEMAAHEGADRGALMVLLRDWEGTVGDLVAAARLLGPSGSGGES